MAETSITPHPNGPYIVKGSVKLVDADGKEWPVEGDTIALCRCGGSQNKPFCDGTHAKIDFKAATKVDS